MGRALADTKCKKIAIKEKKQEKWRKRCLGDAALSIQLVMQK